MRTKSNVQAKIKYIDITSIWISFGKSEKGPMTIEPGIERRKIERDTVYFTDNIDNPDYDTCVYWTVELNQHLNFAWHNRFIEGGK